MSRVLVVHARHGISDRCQSSRVHGVYGYRVQEAISLYLWAGDAESRTPSPRYRQDIDSGVISGRQYMRNEWGTSLLTEGLQ